MAAQTTKRFQKLRSWGAPAGLKATGFRRALRRLVEESIIPEDMEDEDGTFATFEETVDLMFREWFGEVNIVPAAFCIEKRGESEWDTTIHVYEIETSPYLLEEKAHVYSRMADGDGPLVCLHIFDRYGRERIINNDELMCVWSKSMFVERREGEEQKQCEEELKAILRGQDPNASPPKSERNRKWKAAYDALREMGVEI